jgi:hypothetical protein
MGPRMSVGILSIGLAWSLAAGTSASTPATPDQTAAIAAAMQIPAHCVSAAISSHDPTWATGHDTDMGDCPQANGTVVLHRPDSTWEIVTEGSDFGFCPVHGVPAAISTEFKLCRVVKPSDYVLGGSFFGPMGRGFGHAKPRTIYNGGDPAGLVTSIRWKHWGSAAAIGYGKGSIFKPSGGYYPQLVTVELRASSRGRCPGSPLPAYKHLDVRYPSRPGGKLGRYHPWVGLRTIC